MKNHNSLIRGRNDSVVFHLGSLPFYSGIFEPNKKRDLPLSLPFSLYIDRKAAIPRLHITPEIELTLEKAYSSGSMLSTPLGDSRLAENRMNEVIKKIKTLLGRGFNDLRILEVGCGNGTLLNHLQNLGAKVVGCEIGPQAKIAEQRYGINVIQEPLNSTKRLTELAKKYGAEFVDYTGSIQQANARQRVTAGEPDYHPNLLGVYTMADTIYPVIQKFK